jgi:integrase
MKLTEATAAKLRPGKILRDDRFRGLLALGRKGSTTWAYQTDLRRNGRFVRTVRVTLGKQSDMSLKEARVAAAQAQAQIRSGIDPNSESKNAKSLTMLDVIEDHISERSLAERTKDDYRRHWTNKRRNTLYPYRNLHPRDITRDDVRTLKSRLQKRGKTMCSGALRVLRLTLTHAMRMDEGMKENPCQFVVIPSNPKQEPETVNLQEFTCSVIELDMMWRTLWTMSLLTAARASSIKAMRREDVNLEARTIRLTHVKTMKNGATLPIGPRLAYLFEKYLDMPSASEWLWPGNPVSRPLGTVWYRRFGYGTHQLRHNSSALNEVADISACSGVMPKRTARANCLPLSPCE